MWNVWVKTSVRRLKKTFKRNKQFKAFEAINRVLILYDYDKQPSVERLVQPLLKAGKAVKAVSWYPQKQHEPLPASYIIWHPGMVNPGGFPLKKYVEELIDFQADILIDVRMLPNAQTDYLFFQLPIDYRVGLNASLADQLDLLLSCDSRHEFSFFIDQLLFYIKTIRTS